MKGISIVVPTLNEEKNIAKLINRIQNSLAAFTSYEIIFVDDHSKDKTVENIKKFEDKKQIFFFEKVGKSGKAFSLLEGFAKAKFDKIAMIDADLQYPPEAIKEMALLIDKKTCDIVVAKRNEKKISFSRRLFSRAFNLIFARFLHNLNYDVQSGLKIFRKEIVERIKIKPSRWTFDMEFLIKSLRAGYIVKSYSIDFEKRLSGKTKVNLIKTSLEIGLNALKLKFKRSETIPYHPETEKIKGKGFHYNGREFAHWSGVSVSESAFFRTEKNQNLTIILCLIVFAVGAYLNWHETIIVLIAILTSIYFLDLFFNMFLIFRTFLKNPEIHISSEELHEKENFDWPTYTIFCPLYHETNVIPQFVSSMSGLDYPKNKLQVLIILEEDDEEAIEKVKNFSLPSFFQTIIVPHSNPKTKPKALNFALGFATGKFCVIYDAEDVPEKTQLKKTILAFEKAPPKTVCIQAKLNFYNPHQNLITRVFTAEYSVWFDLILTGLQSINAPIPLGGTSNHFRTKDVRNLKGWDSFNVTEDCDLGMRLVKRGFRTAIVNSTTFEEANSKLLNWFKQRTRWIKGYMQTYLVHTRNLKNLPLSFQLVVGGKVFSLLINPIMWVITLIYFVFRSSSSRLIESFFPGPVLYMGVICFIFGNFLYLYYYMVGSAKRKQYSLVKYALLTPIYWLGMSLASYKAVLEMIKNPHYWNKTKHGFHLKNEDHKNAAEAFLKQKLINPNITS